MEQQWLSLGAAHKTDSTELAPSVALASFLFINVALVTVPFHSNRTVPKTGHRHT